MAVSRNDFFALGWMYGKVCSLLDKGFDPREMEVPALMEEFVQVAEDQDRKDQKAAAKEELMHYVNNPSAWRHFDQHLSDLIWKAVDPMPEVEEPEDVKPDRSLGYYWVIPDNPGKWEIARYDHIPDEGNFWFLIENTGIYTDEELDCIGSFVAELGTQS